MIGVDQVLGVFITSWGFECRGSSWFRPGWDPWILSRWFVYPGQYQLCGGLSRKLGCINEYPLIHVESCFTSLILVHGRVPKSAIMSSDLMYFHCCVLVNLRISTTRFLVHCLRFKLLLHIQKSEIWESVNLNEDLCRSAIKVRNIWEMGEFSKVQTFQSHGENADNSLIR